MVRDKERKKKLAELQGEEDYVKEGFHPWISEAPVACVSEKIYHDRYNEPDKLVNKKRSNGPRPIGSSILVLVTCL